MIKTNYGQGEYRSRIKGYNIGTGMGTSGFRKRNKRGNSFDQTKEKHIEINEEEPITSIITQLPQNAKESPANERCFSFSPNRTQVDKLLPPQMKQHINKKTLVLDLDETLVHSGFKPFNPSDIVLELNFDHEIHQIHVLIRPGAETFLERMAQIFELVIFTASLSKYADPLLDILDPQRYCSYRLFREHCTLINGSYVKDLKRLNRDLKDVIILDNSPMSYAFNQYNGFPITSWYNDKNDQELYSISHILEFLGGVNDIRKYLPDMVDNHEFMYHKASAVMNEYYKQMEDDNCPKSSVNQRNTNDDEDIIDNNTTDLQVAKTCIPKHTASTRASKEININIVTNNYTNYFISNNLQKSKDNTTTDQEPSKSLKTALNIFRSSNTNSGIPTNGNNTNVMSSYSNLNANLKLIKTNEPKTAKNKNTIGSVKIKPSTKSSNLFNQKDIKYSSLLDRKDHGQLMKSSNIKHKNSRPVTALNQQTQTQIIEELNQRRKQRHNSKPNIFRSPSFQVTTSVASSSTKNKIRPSSSNNNIHVINSNNKKKPGPLQSTNVNFGSYNRPKSSGRITSTSSTVLQPKTPKIPNNKLTTSSSPLDDIFIKRRLLTTTRHNKLKGSVNIKSANFGSRITPMN